MPSLVMYCITFRYHMHTYVQIHKQNGLGHFLTLATQNCLSGPSDSWIWPLMALPPEPKVLAEMKTKIFCNAF